MRTLFALFLLVLAGCSEPDYAPVRPDAPRADAPEVFVATTRAKAPDGWFSDERGEGLSYVSVPVNFPADYTPGQRALIRQDPDPESDFWISGKTDYSRAAFETALTEKLRGSPPGKRDVTIYVHGFYNTFFNGVFRSAQLSNDFALNGAKVHFSWPSRGSNTGYAYDRESVLYSRDGLESLLRSVSRVGADRVTIIAHSLGAMLVMETLRQIEISEPGWSYRQIDGLAFVSPDIGVEVFKTQAARFDRLPEDMVIFVSNRDQVLMLSSRVAGDKTRLGSMRNIPVTTEGDLTVVDVSALAGSAASGHFIPATSPAAIKLMRDGDDFVDFFPRDGSGQAISANTRLLKVLPLP